MDTRVFAVIQMENSRKNYHVITPVNYQHRLQTQQFIFPAVRGNLPIAKIQGNSEKITFVMPTVGSSCPLIESLHIPITGGA
jgi:hypothetical protein